VSFSFRQEDTRRANLEPTDLLFIDTYHTRQQLEAELAGAQNKLRQYLIFHDTATYAEHGEDGGDGLWPVIAALYSPARGRPSTLGRETAIPRYSCG
jgi:hypothetical protein